MKAPESRTKPRWTDRAIHVWIVIHGIIVLGWSVFWTNHQYLFLNGENPEDQQIVPLLLPTCFAFPAMMIINLAILIVFAIRKQRFLFLLWLLDLSLLLAQMKFMMPLFE